VTRLVLRRFLHPDPSSAHDPLFMPRPLVSLADAHLDLSGEHLATGLFPGPVQPQKPVRIQHGLQMS